MDKKEFKIDKFVRGICIYLIDNNPYDKLDIDIWIDSLFVGSFEVYHYTDINDDYQGKTTSIFRTNFRKFRTTGIIKIMVKTKLLYEQNQMYLLTSCE
jgi:hypothetical protein